MTDEEPSFPTLLAEQARRGITEYLSTTFALADAKARDTLAAFLDDPEHGMFKGPYLRIRTPFPTVGPGWSAPLDWLPPGFVPFRHQAQAFERLSTRDRAARPTIVTTGTGSGKTESFLLPLLDHCRRARGRGEGGIKAIVLYPMNALVTDQARRLARYLHDEPELSAVTAGVYVGGTGTHGSPTRDALVDKREQLRDEPPDILLTNYKMLDLLLQRPSDATLWSASTTSLQYLVLDEFHTYDGAQGTDVAMLLRRLGAACRVAEQGRPLGRVVPVATSATLGSGGRRDELLRFAETVFGTFFGPDAVVTEERLDAEAVVPDIDFELEIPDVDALLDAPEPVASDPTSWRRLAEAGLRSSSTGRHRAAVAPTDPVELGELLRHHFLTRTVVDALGDTPLTPAEAVRRITQAGVLPWGVRASSDSDAVAAALMRYLVLLSAARVRDEHGAARPLVNLQVQLWVRQLSRMLRRVADAPEFAWWHDGPDDAEGRWLPAAHCRLCGRSGWMVVVSELGDVNHESVPVWRASARRSSRAQTRTLLVATGDEPSASFLDPRTLEVRDTAGDNGIPVIAGDAVQSAEQRCPSCLARDSIRFLGSSVATLLSVALTQMFGSDALPDPEKKTLVFTDSVQDAAHRAAFIEGRAFQFNFRSALVRAVGPGPTPLPEAVAALSAHASDAELYAVAPPDFLRRAHLTGEWLKHDPKRRRRELLRTRIEFQAHLEVGRNSRVGRTLELTRSLGVDVDVDLDHAGALARDVHENLPERGLDLAAPEAYRRWVLGLLDHLRTRGGIHHEWLARYIADDGRRWSIWGRSAPGMPKFPSGRPAPGFFTTGAVGDSEFVGLRPQGEGWVTDWTRRCLEIGAGEAKALLGEMIDALADEQGPLERRTSGKGARVYGLRPARIVLQRDEARLQCPVCHHVQPCAPGRARVWEDAPCPRMRCTGRLIPASPDAGNFYRALYRSGRIRRIVTHEHTGLLARDEREEVERQFIAGTSPVAPNILTATPTLELGIDIGDLSTIALASLPRTPASYLQRVGRAGRSTGNAFIVTAVPTGARDLYYFAEPRHLLDGDVRPPGAYLEATELLERQFLAFCLDRVAAGDVTLPTPMPPILSAVLSAGLADGSWLLSLVDHVERHADELANAFLAGYRRLSDAACAGVRKYPAGRLRSRLARTAHEWQTETAEIGLRMGELTTTIGELSGKGLLGDREREDLARCRGEWATLKTRMQKRSSAETLTGLTALGLLPNYNLLDDATTLDVRLWWSADPAEPGGEREPQAVELTYERSSRTALTELAPGAFFYADGKRVEIDAVDLGPPAQPLWQTWRLCPGCGWGEPAAGPIASCPRCQSGAVADTGARHHVLPLRRVSAVNRLDDVVIDEDDDERTRTMFTTVTCVDVDPADVAVGAWALAQKVFGAEYARRATVRTLNTGEADGGGPEIDVAGQRVTASRFATCTHCGVVRRPHVAASDVRHRGFCPVRRGRPESWESLLLSHELVTQAVRIVLPVSTLRVETNLVSFTGALALGLRQDFGGDPQHLAVVTSTMVDAQKRTRRFVVLHDTVPGGTGYLDRLGDEARMRTILTAARDLLARCPCQAEGRAACHRCLLGVVRSRDVPHADRRVALELLDDLLAAWTPVEVPTVSAVDIGPVQLSELERRFREVLTERLDVTEGCSYTTTSGPTGEQLDIRLVGPGGDPRRWTMRPLVDVVAAGVATQPDFLLTRGDAQGFPVAVYLDGRQFHASPTSNITDDDATKRAALRDGGRRVFSLTWQDVEAFAKSDKPSEPDLLSPSTRNKAEGQIDDAKAARPAWSNPLAFLLAYLADPDSLTWGRTAQQTVLAVADAGKHGDSGPVLVERAHLSSALQAAAQGTPPAPSSGPIMIIERRGVSGLPLSMVADPADVENTLGAVAVLDDRTEVVGGPEHEKQWRDWLRWGNLLQFLTVPTWDDPRPSRMAEVWTRRSLGVFAARPLPLASAATSDTAAATVPVDWRPSIEFTDAAVHPIVVALAAADHTVPEPGGEVGDDEVWQVELSWPKERIAVVVDVVPERDRWLAAHGWRIVNAGDGADPGPATRRVLGWLEGGES